MNVVTKISWDTAYNQAQLENMASKLAEMVVAGKTDGRYTTIWPNREPNPPAMFSARWNTITDAEEWCGFLQTLDIVPQWADIYVKQVDPASTKNWTLNKTIDYLRSEEHTSELQSHVRIRMPSSA